MMGHHLGFFLLGPGANHVFEVVTKDGVEHRVCLFPAASKDERVCLNPTASVKPLAPWLERLFPLSENYFACLLARRVHDGENCTRLPGGRKQRFLEYGHTRQEFECMSQMTYTHAITMGEKNRDKPLVWLAGEVKTPPFSQPARLEAGFLLRRLQRGEKIGMPQSRPMPSIGLRCHELRINDLNATWRIVYRIDTDAIVILEVFKKTTSRTPAQIIETCKRRLRVYDSE